MELVLQEEAKDRAEEMRRVLEDTVFAPNVGRRSNTEEELHAMRWNAQNAGPG